MTTLICVKFGLPLLMASTLFGQLPDQLTENTAKTTVSIKMDRDVYFADEFFQVTIEITNPTSGPLVVEAPFHESGCILVLRKEGDRLVPTDDPAEVCRDRGQASPTTLNPGERRRTVLGPLGFDDSGWPAITALHGMAFKPGSYVLQYSYGAGATAEFEIVAPGIEAAAIARIKDEMYSDRPDQQEPRPLPAYVAVVSYRWQERSYICVSQDVATNLERSRELKPDQPYAPGLDACKRVATSEEPVVKLSATSDPEENLTIEWTTASGRQDKVYYPASYVLRDANHRERKRMLEELNKDK